MLTDVDAVYVDYGLPTQRALGAVSVEEVEQYTFPAGSMGPKVEAACDFARSTGKMAVIGSLNQAADVIGGDKGTRLTLHAG
jgi:carbamate kinase